MIQPAGCRWTRHRGCVFGMRCHQETGGPRLSSTKPYRIIRMKISKWKKVKKKWKKITREDKLAIAFADWKKFSTKVDTEMPYCSSYLRLFSTNFRSKSVRALAKSQTPPPTDLKNAPCHCKCQCEQEGDLFSFGKKYSTIRKENLEEKTAGPSLFPQLIKRIHWNSSWIKKFFRKTKKIFNGNPKLSA